MTRRGYLEVVEKLKTGPSRPPTGGPLIMIYGVVRSLKKTAPVLGLLYPWIFWVGLLRSGGVVRLAIH